MLESVPVPAPMQPLFEQAERYVGKLFASLVRRPELHGREVRCVARGEDNCEFIMACSDRLEGHEQRLRAAWKNG